MNTYDFEVISAPVAKARPRFGKGRVFTPRATEKHEWEIRQAFLATFPAHVPLEGPVSLKAKAFIAMPKSIPKKRRETALPVVRPDAANLLKCLEDALNGVAWKNDAQLTDIWIAKRYVNNGDVPRWEVSIFG